MKKVFLVLVCALICAVSYGQTQNNMESEVKWTDLPICQSCGMPMMEEHYGTNADGAVNHEYCKYCYADGQFTAPDLTMDEMIEVCVPFMVEQGMTEELARGLLKEALPKLKRWRLEE